MECDKISLRGIHSTVGASCASPCEEIMKVILEPTTAEVIEKKSRFIANVFYVVNVEEAESKLIEIKKKYFDAKHNCFAYIIGKMAI